MTIDIRHPSYLSDFSSWQLWRAVQESGQPFVDEYLRMFSTRETQADFDLRKSITPCPAYAKSAMLEVRNGIYAKMHDIVREGGSESYKNAVAGIRGGVDLSGKSMNYFIGFQVLEELISMKRVGVMVDRAPKNRRTRADAADSPYLYMYTAEDILSWNYDRAGRLIRVLLRETDHEEEDGLPNGILLSTRYRLMTLTQEGVDVKVYDTEDNVSEEYTLDLPEIPFVIAEISESLLKDTAKYQVALLNMESSDINYCIHANFPFYVEQSQVSARDFTNQPEGGTKIELGVTKGRRYGPGMEKPDFIHPSSEPLKASIEKQEKMQQTIRHLMHLTIASLKPVRASEESKNKDQDGLRSGLSYIGLELERVERQVSVLWHNYLAIEPATVHYPQDYDIETDEQRIHKVNQLRPLMALPSINYRRELASIIADTLLRSKVSPETLQIIQSEITEASVINMDTDSVRKDVDSGLLDHASGAAANAYPAGVSAKAKEEHIERLTAIALAQSSVRGVAPGAAAADKLDPNSNNGHTPSRGEEE